MTQSQRGGYAVTFSVKDEATGPIDAIQRRIRQLREPIDRMRRDTQDFINPQGLRKVSDAFGDIGRQAATAFSSLSRLVPVMGAIGGAASLAGLVGMGRQWASFATQLKRDSDYIRGSTPQALQQLQRAFTLVGGSAEQVTGTLKDLTNTAAAAFRGDATAATWFRTAGINLEGFNGQLRPTTELLPEVLTYISSLKDPTDRLTAANGFGSSALRDMVQQLEAARRPGENLADTYRRVNEQAAQYPTLTDKQIAAMQRHQAAMASLGVSVDALGQRVGTNMASAFTPFVEALDKFAKDPATIKAVDDLTEAFRELLEGLDWGYVLGFLRDTVREITKLIQLIKDAVKWVRGFKEDWAKLWGGQAAGAAPAVTEEDVIAGMIPGGKAALAAQRAQTDAAASAAGGASGGVLGKAWDWISGGGEAAAPEGSRGATVPTPANNNTPIGTGGGGFKDTAGDLTKRLARNYGLTTAQAAGLVGNLGYESGGFKQLQEKKPLVPGSRGGYGYAQWTGARRTEFEAWSKGKGLDPSSHEANVGFLEHELSGKYAHVVQKLRGASGIEEASRITHRHYETPADVQGANPSYASAGGRLRYARQAHELAMASPANLAQGAPAEVTGGPPVNGAVDVTITHKNPPPGATVTASATGDATVGEPRTEQQQLANVG